MRLNRNTTAILFGCALIVVLAGPLEAADEAVCYAAADDENWLISSWRTGGGFDAIGAFGVGGIEAITFNLDTSLLYGANGGTLGSINITTGAFTAIGAAGTADGAVGTVTVDDLDGLAFDPTTGILYGAQREGGDDLLVQLDPATGAVVQDAFGPGVDYVVILASPITGFDDIDDLAVDPTTGQMYGISNDGGNDDRLVKIDKLDGSVIDVGAFIGTDDMEGLSVTPDGELFGTTGNGGGNSLWNIDKLTGFATFVYAYEGGYSDIEGVSCLRSNVITGTVFVDTDSDGTLDPGELGLAGVTVRLWRDNNNDGTVDGGDTLAQTVVTPASGFYEFFLSATGNYVLEIDTATLPSGWSLTTDNVEEADFTNYGNVDTDNNFGAIGAAVDLTVSKTADLASACPGDVVTYTITVANNSTTTAQTAILVSDALPVGATYVAQSTVASGWTNVAVGNFRDDFNTVAYNNNDGTLNWSDDWIESFDGGGSPSGGDIQIVGHDGRNALRLRDDGNAIRREANLDPATYASATLTIEYERDDFDDTDEYVELVIWDGSNFYVIDTFAGPATDTEWILATYDITPYMATDTVVGFTTSAAMSDGDEFYVDYVEITVANPGSGTKDNVPGGTYGDLLDGVPPSVVASADGFYLPVGETMTVTFQATVDNPYNGTSPLVNVTSATSAEGGFDIDSTNSTVSLATIGNLVWHDFHPNDMQDADEPGIPDVPITVWGPGPDGNLGTGDDVYVWSTFTDANGNYSFPNLGPGDYRVDINEDWLDANGYPERRYPAAAGYWDLDDSDLPSLVCGGSQLGADFGYWDGSTVPVTLSSFAASEGRRGTLLEWTTATQVGTVGFNLYAVTGSGWRRLNPELIPAHTPDATTPQHYSFETAVVEAEGFAVEDIDLRGQRRRHGPFAREGRHGLDPVVAPETAVDWPAIRGEHLAKAAVRRRAGEGGLAAAKSSLRDGGGRRAPWGEVARFLVDDNGLYRVDHEDLLSIGVDLTGVDAARLALTSGGEAVPILVRGGPVFGPGSSLEWVGRRLDTLYTRTNVYLLRLEPRHAARVGVEWRTPAPDAVPAEFYMETAISERNRSYSFAAPNGDPWYDTAILAFTEPKSADFQIIIDELFEGGDLPLLEVEMWGTTEWPASPDHHVAVDFNGVPVADEVFDGLTDHPLAVELPAGVLADGVNTLELTLPGDTGVEWDMVTFDGFRVTYPRRFQARDGRLEFEIAAEAVRVDNLPNPNVLVYRVDDDTTTLLAGASVAAGDGGFSVTFPGSDEMAHYVVSSSWAVRTPRLEPARDGSQILEGRADYLVIAHPDFIDGLAPLVSAREAEGWEVTVADVEDVYAAFSQGIVDPWAIQSYIAWAADELGTEMVLLVGGDTYDYHDHLGLGSMSFIPSLYAATGAFVHFAPVDPLFTDIDGDGLPDLPIGRLPVRTSAELEAVVGKTLDYAAKSYPQTGVFAADREESSGESFAAISNSFIARLPSGWAVDRAHIDATSLPHSRAVLIGAINRGVALTSYFGHSGPTVWSFDNLFHVSDALALSNRRLPTVVTQWGCWNTYYVEPTNNTMGHALLLSGDRGAAAVFGAATLTESTSDEALGLRFIPRLIEPGVTVGSALQWAKEDLAASDPGLVDVLLGWTLLGDPALVIEPW